MKLSDLAVDRPVTMLMGICSLLVLGAIAWTKIPLTFLPNVDFPRIWIEVQYPNSNPTQTEKEIVKPLEEVLSTLSGLKKIESTAEADSASISLEFSWGDQIDLVRMAVGEKIDLVKSDLPKYLGPIFIYNFNAQSIPVVQARISSKGMDLSSAYDLLEKRVVNRIRRLPGVAKVDIGGVAPPEVFIDLILAKVIEYNIDIGDLIRSLQGSNMNLAMGQMDAEGLRYYGRVINSFSDLEAIKNFQIKNTSLVLSDIAEISLEEPPLSFGRYLDRQYAVSLEVFKESTANTVETVKAILKTMKDEIAIDPMLKGIEFFVWEDQAEEITRGISGIRQSGIWGGIFATIVLYIFIRRLDATLIVSASIPIAIIGAIATLYFMDATLNVLSMMGLMLGVGMLVDNAVVVLEAIYRQRSMGAPPKEAAKIGTQDVGTAVSASTLTTMIVFLPLIVGSRSELITWLREIGIALCLSLLCSWLSSLTLIPLAASHLLHKAIEPPVPWLQKLSNRYGQILYWTQHHRWWTLLLMIVTMGIGILPFFIGLKTGLFAGGINKRIWIEYNFKDFTYKSQAAQYVAQVEDLVFQNAEAWNVSHVYSWFGENRASTGLFMKNPEISDEDVKELRQKIREKLPVIPGVRLEFDNSKEEGGQATYFSINLYGEDTETLTKLGDQVMEKLHPIANIWDVQSSARGEREEVQVRLDRQKAVQLGLSAQDLAEIFQFTLGGQRLRRFNTGSREVDMRISLRLLDRRNAEDLRQMILSIQNGQKIRLGDIATFEIVERANEIHREGRKTRVEIDATYEGDQWKETRETITGMMNGIDLPPGTSWSFGARIQEQDEQNKQMIINLVLALLLVYIVMASLFESLIHPIVIVFSIPFSIVGVAWLLYVTQTPMNIFSQIGILILMGIVVNNGIVLIDHIHKLRATGLSRADAVLQGSLERFRPILITATTTILGLLPMAVGKSGIGGGYYFPLARTVIGGLTASTFLTILVLPTVYVFLDDIGIYLKRLWGNR